MKKLISILIFFLFIVSILYNYIDIIDSIHTSFNICINTLFPSIIPFMLLSNILINYNIINELNSNILSKIFNINKPCTITFIFSLLTGSPSNSKYLNDLYNKNLINEYDIQKCINFMHYNNPIFILNTVGLTLFNNKKIGLILLISQILSSIILGIFIKNKFIYIKSNIINKSNKSFIKVLNESIVNIFNTLLLILGIITTFLCITTIINKILNISDNYKFIYGLLEVTQGLKYLSISNIPINIKLIISSFLLSFGGICIHMQVFSILDNKKIRYMPYLLSRILQGILSSILASLLYIVLYL